MRDLRAPTAADMHTVIDEQAIRADERKRMADQLRDGLEHLDRDGTYGTLVSPGEVAQLIAKAEAGR